MGKIKEEKTRQDRKRRLLILSLAAVLILAVGALAFVIINHCKSNGYGVGRYN